MPDADTLARMKQNLAQMDQEIVNGRAEARRLRAAGLVEEASAVERDLALLEGKGRQLRVAYGL